MVLLRGYAIYGTRKGDVMSAEGGVFYIGSTANAVKVFVAGGVQDVAKSKAITTGMPAGAETIVQPVSSSLDDDEILLRNRSQRISIIGMVRNMLLILLRGRRIQHAVETLLS